MKDDTVGAGCLAIIVIGAVGYFMAMNGGTQQAETGMMLCFGAIVLLLLFVVAGNFQR